MTDEAENRIDLEDNSDRDPPNMSDKQEQDQGQEQTQEQKPQEQAQEQTQGKDGGWYEKPGNMGNAGGEWLQSKLNPVGQYTGKGFEAIGKPIGGIVDPLVGGLMRSGEGFGDTVGVGFGNKEGGPAAQQEAEGKRMKEPIAGEEQTAENPLGLNQKA